MTSEGLSLGLWKQAVLQDASVESDRLFYEQHPGDMLNNLAYALLHAVDLGENTDPVQELLDVISPRLTFIELQRVLSDLDNIFAPTEVSSLYQKVLGLPIEAKQEKQIKNHV